MNKDMCIRKVKVLQGNALVEANKQQLNPDDLVIVTTTIYDQYPPSYSVEKIEGDPISYLLKRCAKTEEEKDNLEATVDGFEHGSI
jgi:hypothetical protein